MREKLSAEALVYYMSLKKENVWYIRYGDVAFTLHSKKSKVAEQNKTKQYAYFMESLWWKCKNQAYILGRFSRQGEGDLFSGLQEPRTQFQENTPVESKEKLLFVCISIEKKRANCF